MLNNQFNYITIMKKSLILGAFAALVLTACSNDELTSVNRDGDEITFSVVTNSTTRAADVYCNNNKPEDFKVWATYDNKTYIDGDKISFSNGAWTNTSGTRYWPEGEVTFFAQKNADDEFKWDVTGPKIEDFTVGSDVSEQKDLIYAVKSAKQADGKVTLNFRHALSQVVFQAKNTNANLYVEISGVSICKVGYKNTFTYPTSATDNNIENHEGTTGTITYDGTWGTWATLNGGVASYSVSFDAVAVPGTGEIKSLTNTNETDKEFSSKALLLLPQETTAWDVEASDAKGNPSLQAGSYFLVKCQIYNVAGSTVDKNSDVCLWGKEGAADVAIPVALKWDQGKKYVYTFVFGNGNGGFNPDPTPDTPTPVLVPITFDVTVDDFVPVDNQDIEMK